MSLLKKKIWSKFPDLNLEELTAVVAAAKQAALDEAVKIRKCKEQVAAMQRIQGMADTVKNLEVDNTTALMRFQDEVWRSLGSYSSKLGWGLTGIQPECWACLDMAVDELVVRRNNDKRNALLMERLLCGCISTDCKIHGSYNPDDLNIVHVLITTGKAKGEK